MDYKVCQPGESDEPCACGVYYAVLIFPNWKGHRLCLCRNCLEVLRAMLKDAFKAYEVDRLARGDQGSRLTPAAVEAQQRIAAEINQGMAAIDKAFDPPPDADGQA